MESFMRRVNSFRKYQKDEKKSLKVLTSPRRKSFETSFLFLSNRSETKDTLKSCSETDVATELSSGPLVEVIGDNGKANPAKEEDTIEDLLKVQRFRPQLDFMRKFLREYSRRQLNVPCEIPTEIFERNGNEMQKCAKKSEPPRPFDKAFSCPQIGFDMVNHLKGVYPPSYWLTCTYRFVAESKDLLIVIRQTGTLPEMKFSKLSATIEIDGGQGDKNRMAPAKSQKDKALGKQVVVLAKSLKDKSFKSHEIVFNDQDLGDLKEKMLSLKIFAHNTPYRKKCVGNWEIELTDLSVKDKIGCKRFVFEI